MMSNVTYKKLGEVATYVNGYAFKPETWSEKGLPIIRIQNLNNGEAAYNYYEGDLPAKFIVEKGDLLISWSASLGSYFWQGEKAYLNQHIFKVVFDKSDIDKTYLKYAVDAKLEEMKRKVHGATMQHIVKKDFDDTLIPVPSLEDQQRIVRELDAIHAILASKNEQLRELDKLAQAVFYDMFGDPITNEKGWEISTLGELFDIGSSKRVYQSEWTNAGVPFYRAREVVKLAKDGFVDNDLFITESLYSQYAAKYGVPVAGDILVTAVGTLGVTYIVKDTDRFYYKDGNIICLHQNGSPVDSIYVDFCFKTPFVREQIDNWSGATVGTFTIVKAKSTRIPLPPLDLQQAFATKITAIEQQKELIRASIAETETLLAARMQHYFD